MNREFDIIIFEEIINKLGKPPLNFLNKISSEVVKTYAENGSKKRDACKATDLSDPKAKDLINKLLVTDPDQRFSAEDALKHKYFKEFHDPTDEPTFEGNIDDTFENDYNQTLMQLRQSIIEEINKINEKNLETKRYHVEKIMENCKRKIE